MRVRTLLVMGAAAASALAAAPTASAQNPRTPGDCRASRLSLDPVIDKVDVRQGDTVNFTFDIANEGAAACQVSNASIVFYPPTPTGSYRATYQVMTAAPLLLPAGTPPASYGPYSYTVDFNPGVKVLNARAATVGAIQWNGADSAADVGKDTAVFPFTPSITIDKVGSITGPLPAPQSVTYKFYVRNGTPATIDASASDLSNVTVTDDKCGKPAYESGDANGDGKLQRSETWVFTCTLLHPAPGTYVNTAVANGNNVLYGRSVPVVSPPDTWTVVLTAPPVTPPATNPPGTTPPGTTPPGTTPQGSVLPVAVVQAPCALSRVGSTTVRAGQLNTIRVRVRNVDAGTTATLTLPGNQKVTAKTDKNGLATFRVRPAKSGTARIRAAECSDVENVSVKAARRVVAQRAPRVTG